MTDDAHSPMEALVRAFPAQLREALQIQPQQAMPAPDAGTGKLPQQLLVAGMGGSGVAAPLLASLASLRAPLQVLQDYRLPDWVGPQTLVVASSHSGNTAETLSAAHQALERGCRVAVLSAGGQLADLARSHALSHVALPSGRPPRSCLGYSFVLLARVLTHYGFLPQMPETDILRTADRLEQHQSEILQQARQLAEKLHARSGEGMPMPYLMASQQWAPVLRRWCQQLQENTKVHAFAAPFPEMNHNALVAWSEAQPALFPLFLESALDDRRIAERMSWTRQRLVASGQDLHHVQGHGTEAWEQAFAWIHLGDWLSVEWARLRGVDAMDIGIIEALKTHLGGGTDQAS
jgi:glucose/mannose-6-phosphate isomerase